MTYRLQPSKALTWDEVRARSEGVTKSGMRIHCGDCDVYFHRAGIPCIKHTLADEEPYRNAVVAHMLSKVRLG